MAGGAKGRRSAIRYSTMRSSRSLSKTFRLRSRAFVSVVASIFTAALLIPVSAQDYFSEPEDGGDFTGAFTLTFVSEMQETIALRFEGAGGVQFDCEWMTFGGLLPPQILECTPQGALPPGSTVTWTLNPDGTGFTTADGRVLPTSSGTFVVSGDPANVTMTADPGGGTYDPASDGPVTFTFSEAMNTTIDPNVAVDLNPGTWNCAWIDDRTIACTIQLPAAAAEYFYTLSGLETASGVAAPTFEGGFTIQSGDVLTVSTPDFFYDPARGPFRLVFSAEMDQSVDLGNAVTIFPGSWQYAWGNSVTLECSPIGGLEEGMYTYILSVDDFRSVHGAALDPMGGSDKFIVSTGGGTAAPDCPAEMLALPFPKTMAVCGAEHSSWDSASVYPDRGGTGYVVSGWSENDIESLMRLDAQGQTTATVRTVDPGTELITGPDPDRFLAARLSDDFDQLELGVYQFNAARTPVFQRALNIEDPDVATDYLSNGRIAVVQDLDNHIEVILLNADGTVAWAKRYASALFGGSGGGLGFGEGQFVSLSEMPSGYLLDIAQTQFTGDGSAITNILVRLNDNGSLQWARRYTGLDTFGAPFAQGLTSGSILLWSAGFAVGEEEDSVFSHLVKLNADGSLSWAKRVSGLYLMPVGELPGDKHLLMGREFANEGTTSSARVLTLTAGGEFDRQVQLDSSEAGLGFAMVDGQRIRYSLVAAADPENPDSPLIALVGSSNLELEDWIWREYARPVDHASLVPEPDSSQLLFYAFRDTAHALDVIRLSDNLQATTPCTLFTDAAVGILPSNLAMTDASIDVSAVTVTITDFSPEFANTSIALQSITVADQSVCTTDAVDPTPVRIEWTVSSTPGQITLEFLSVPGFNFAIERTNRLEPGTAWVVVETIEGTGARISRSLDADGPETYFRITTSGR
jgi:hypothetical protein